MITLTALEDELRDDPQGVLQHAYQTQLTEQIQALYAARDLSNQERNQLIAALTAAKHIIERLHQGYHNGPVNAT